MGHLGMSRITVREQADGKLIGWQPSTDPAHRGLQKPPPRRVASLNTDGSWQLPSVPAPEFLSRVLTVPLENPSIEGITTLANNFTHLATLSANFLSFAVSGSFCDRAAVGTALEITLEVAAVKNCCKLGVSRFRQHSASASLSRTSSPRRRCWTRLPPNPTCRARASSSA